MTVTDDMLDDHDRADEDEEKSDKKWKDVQGEARAREEKQQQQKRMMVREEVDE